MRPFFNDFFFIQNVVFLLYFIAALCSVIMLGSIKKYAVCLQARSSSYGFEELKKRDPNPLKTIRDVFDSI